jgi:hypothetical protein
MARSFWDDVFDIAVFSLAAYGVVKLVQAHSNNQPYNTVQPRPFTVQHLRSETQIALNMKDAQIEQLTKRVAALESQNETLLPFSEFLKRKSKEAEATQITPSKPKPHLWR